MKKYLLSAIVGILLFSAGIRILPVYAQSGSSTCQVTARAVETPPPSEPGGGGNGDPEEPGPGREPGDVPPEDIPRPGEEPEDVPPEGTPEPGGGPGTPSEDPGNGDGGQLEDDRTEPEPDGPGAVPGQEGEPGSEEGRPEESGDAADDGTDPSQPPEEPSQSMEPLQPGPDEELGADKGLFWRFLAALLFLGIMAVLVATGAYSYIWVWLLFLFCRKSRRRFHGILTGEKSIFIRVRGAQEGSRTVQEVIDSTGSLAECRDEVMEETAVTEIPRQSRMHISYHGSEGKRHSRETAADEQAMFHILGKLEGAGDVEVKIRCKGTGIDVALHFHI